MLSSLLRKFCFTLIVLSGLFSGQVFSDDNNPVSVSKTVDQELSDDQSPKDSEVIAEQETPNTVLLQKEIWTYDSRSQDLIKTADSTSDIERELQDEKEAMKNGIFQLRYHSELFADVDEARKQLAERVSQFSHQLIPDHLRPRQSQEPMSFENLKRLGALKQEIIEKMEIRAGSIPFEMYQVFWDLELTPEYLSQARTDARMVLQRQRVLTVVCALAVVTVLLGTGSFLLSSRWV